MSTAWDEDLDLDAAETDLDTEDEDSEDDYPEWEDDWDGDGEDAESRASRRRRRERARRVALARRRQQLVRARTGRGRPPARRSTAAAIKAVDLQAKVADDALRREVASLRRAATRSSYATVAGIAVNQFVESFEQPENAFARAALRFAPALLLTPQRRRPGVEGWLTDPRVVGGAAVLGLTVLGERRDRATIEVAGVAELAPGTSAQLAAQVLSTGGRVVTGRTVRWESSDPSVATVDQATGLVTAQKKAGSVFLTVTAEGVPARRVPLVVR